jgi:pre-rRNA-processing protein IPI3
MHVWSLSALLSFTNVDSSDQADPRAPIHTLSNHRGAITALACGHGHGAANIAVSTSADSTAIVWDYRKGIALRTYLLSGVPCTLALDAIDRGFYTAYDDGSIQLIDLYRSTGTTNTLYDEAHSQTAVQPGDENKWIAAAQELGSTLCLAMSWDGSRIISGHQSGKIAAWDPGKGRFLSILATQHGPVSNLCMLPPAGFPNATPPTFKVHTVVKPRFDLESSGSGSGSMIPGQYTFTAQFTSQLEAIHLSATEVPTNAKSEFDVALTHPSFPPSMIDSGLAELASWRQTPPSDQASKGVEPPADFLSFDEPIDVGNGKKEPEMTLKQENELLKKQVASLQRVQKISFKQLADSRKEIKALVEEQRKRDGGIAGGDSDEESGEEDEESGDGDESMEGVEDGQPEGDEDESSDDG